MFGWSRLARIWRSARKRSTIRSRVEARLDELDGDALLVLVVGAAGQPDRAHAAAAQLLEELVGADALPQGRGLLDRGQVEGQFGERGVRRVLGLAAQAYKPLRSSSASSMRSMARARPSRGRRRSPRPPGAGRPWRSRSGRASRSGSAG